MLGLYHLLPDNSSYQSKIQLVEYSLKKRGVYAQHPTIDQCYQSNNLMIDAFYDIRHNDVYNNSYIRYFR